MEAGFISFDQTLTRYNLVLHVIPMTGFYMKCNTGLRYIKSNKNG